MASIALTSNLLDAEAPAWPFGRGTTTTAPSSARVTWDRDKVMVEVGFRISFRSKSRLEAGRGVQTWGHGAELGIGLRVRAADIIGSIMPDLLK